MEGIVHQRTLGVIRRPCAIELVRRVARIGMRDVTVEKHLEHIPKRNSSARPLRRYIVKPPVEFSSTGRTLDRRLWEVGLAMTVRDAFKAGNLFLAGSKRHVSFSKMIYSDERWEEERPRAYADLSLPRDPKVALD